MTRKLTYFIIIFSLLLASVVSLSNTNKTLSPQHAEAQVSYKSNSLQSTRELYVSNDKTNSILVFDASASGNISPVREIKGMSQATGIALDIDAGEVYVAEPANNSISIYDKKANGKVEPLRSIFGSHTNLDWPQGIAINVVDNEIYVPNLRNKSITVYSRTARGDVSPIRLIKGEGTDLIGPVCISYDSKHKEILVINHDLHRHLYNVIAFDKEASGNVKPKRHIFTTKASSEIEISPEGITIDAKRDQILITYSKQEMPDSSAYYIEVYNRTTDGSIVRLKKLADNMSGMDGLFVDSMYDDIFVTDSMHNAIFVYKRDQPRSAAPARIIAGNATGLSYPRNIVVHSK